MRRGIGRLRAGGSGFSPGSLFAAGEQGGWYDPSDLSSMFSDSAGTTPATVEGPVGKINDKSGRGNHLIQATAASRPTLSARYNRLTKTEAFDDATWTKGSLTVTANADGTADKLIPAAASASHTVSQTIPSGALRARVRAKAGEYSFIAVELGNTGPSVFFNLSTGAVGTINGTATPSITAASDAPGYYDCVVDGTQSGSLSLNIYVAQANGVFVNTGDGTSGVFASRADVRTSADAALSIPAYQSVDTATSYNTSGFPMYLSPDGVDDNMASGAFVMPSTATMAASILFTNAAGSVGNVFDGITLRMIIGAQTGNAYRFYDGALEVNGGTRDAAAHVLLGNFAGAASTLEVDASTVASGSNPGTTGMSGGLRLFADQGAVAQFMSGRFYGGVALARALTATEKTSLYHYLGSKAGVSL